MAAAAIPRICLDSEGHITHRASILLVTLGVIAAVAVILDKVADHHSGKIDVITTAGQEKAGVRAIHRISSLLEEVHQLRFVGQEAAPTLVEVLRRGSLAMVASAPIVGQGVRASYYRLSEDADGYRSLVHVKSFGRQDEALTRFSEREDPNREIWDCMDQPDTECKIRSEPEAVQGLDWASRRYKTFVTVPIKAANKVSFGMLTMNASEVGDLTELDRVCAIAMARVLAMADAELLDHVEMNTLAQKEAERGSSS
ncbi:hypothetical protein [Mycolicibacterium fortuitum]|uniref:GAF domain-containing protein n=1 Tax=Mycolicibacterium fortuitum TaxID=1766 RepID=A0AAE4VFI4_MYCFO|nr:hypothetical protein [Mycolicibacterium fortuitum]MCV7142883.1 hypothetical protein [Mycolicibacterium fortuitum]MDV7190600.1 hypothetical protein [Mycolicibacterium fortuitum]MDV7207921.1 hypothetical protein [Mycolicibacterium fortuitum]MDV7229864.1 hypothetical protein [Mycolicibacterium fortuitum]MDV7257791.1 hypothetical protein [Mycolicibacterium fortuitum]